MIVKLARYCIGYMHIYILLDAKYAIVAFLMIWYYIYSLELGELSSLKTVDLRSEFSLAPSQ